MQRARKALFQQHEGQHYDSSVEAAYDWAHPTKNNGYSPNAICGAIWETWKELA